MDLSEKNRRTMLSLAADLKEKKISSVELVKECFQKVDERDNTVKAFLSIDREAVLKAAEEADKRRAEGKALSDLLQSSFFHRQEQHQHNHIRHLLFLLHFSFLYLY